MKIEFTVYLALGLVCAGLVGAILASLVHRKTLHLTERRLEATLAQATRDLQTNLEQLKNQTTTRIADLEQAIDALKVEYAATNIELVSLKAQAQETSFSSAPRVAPSESEDTWTRGEGSADISIVPTVAGSIVPTVAGSNDNDTWVRDAHAPDPVSHQDSATLLAKVFSQGNLFTVAEPVTAQRN
jgi:hypothetical protein